MSGDSQKLLELAEMVEKATGPDWDLDRLIINAVFPEVQVGGVPRYTASLDAALTLYISKPDTIPTNPRIASANALRERANQK